MFIATLAGGIHARSDRRGGAAVNIGKTAQISMPVSLTSYQAKSGFVGKSVCVRREGKYRPGLRIFLNRKIVFSLARRYTIVD